MYKYNLLLRFMNNVLYLAHGQESVQNLSYIGIYLYYLYNIFINVKHTPTLAIHCGWRLVIMRYLLG
jgi:hypothetical protein